MGAVPLLATSVPEYDEYVVRTLNATNAVYHEFLRSEEGQGFNGQVCLIGKCSPPTVLFHVYMLKICLLRTNFFLHVFKKGSNHFHKIIHTLCYINSNTYCL